MCLLVVVTLLIGGVILLLYGSLHVNYRSQRIHLAMPQIPTANSESYSDFLASSSVGYVMKEPQTTSFYVFNVTNVANVLTGSLPQVEQLGPYVYTQINEKLDVKETSNPTTISYRVHSNYIFDAKRSNGSETDVITSVNTTYARTLAKLAKAGFTEQLLAASFAQTELTKLESYLRGPFIAQTKQRALASYLHEMDSSVRRAALPASLSSFQAQVASYTLPENLEIILSHVRQSRVPSLLSDLYDSFLVQYIPATLSSQYTSLRQLSVPRILSNTMHRLQVEATPTIASLRAADLRQQAEPSVLRTILPRIVANIAVPHVIRDYMESACFESVPSMLNTLKNELIQKAIGFGVTPAEAQQYTLVQWATTSSSSWTNIDGIVGGNATGTPRYGFELNSIPITEFSGASRTLSMEVAALLFGVKVNVEFSLLTYDPNDANRGFGLWKRAVNNDATAISNLLAGINNEVAIPADYITTAQINGVCQYILYWKRSATIHRDRQRYWATPFTKRTANSNNEPEVDLDLETVGNQLGFSLQTTSPDLSDITLAKLWDPSISPSFLSTQGFLTWSKAMNGDATSQSTIRNVFVLTSQQLSDILAWLTTQTASATLKTQALRHWARGGTCPTPFNNVTSCTLYDLEPTINGIQSGYELPRDTTIVWSDALVAALWDSTNLYSFTSTSGVQQWNAIATSSTALSTLTASLNALNLGVITENHVRQVSSWLQLWAINPLLQQVVHQWWQDPTTFPVLSVSTSLQPFLLNRPTLSAAVAEALWESTNPISFFNTQGYALWMQDSAASQLTALNAQVALTCGNLLGGAYSAYFSTLIAGSCNVATLADISAIQTYVRQLNQDPYVKNRLLEQWRCGATEWDLEMYRPGIQLGWELCQDSSCQRTQSNHTVCTVPTTALQVWDASSSASLLNPSIFQTLWRPLLSTAPSAASQAALASALGQAQYTSWMEALVSWVKYWVDAEYTQRDVLGLWWRASCSIGSILLEAQTTSTIADANCVPGLSSTSNETTYTSTLVGGRPSTYFLSDYALTSYLDVTSITLQTSKSIASCDNGVRTTNTTTIDSTTTTCLMTDIDSTLPGIQRGFELNAPLPSLTINTVMQLWNPVNAYSFLNPNALDVYWSKADNTPAKLDALWRMIQVDSPSITLADTSALSQWLKAWRHNELMSLFVLKGWLAPTNATIPTFDMIPSSPEIDSGFELRWCSAMVTTPYPTLTQAQYLWDYTKDYSFLAHSDPNLGYNTWIEAYTGPLPGSERLSPEYPPFARVVRTNQVGKTSAISRIQAATGLTLNQIQAIASWLMQWPDHSFLWRDVMLQWQTQMTQFTDIPTPWNLAAIDWTRGSTTLNGFELPTMTATQARSLWDIYTPHSFLNPNILIVWCFVLPSIKVNCPHLIDPLGDVTSSALQELTSTLTTYQTLVYADKTFSGVLPADRARNFFITVSGLTTPSVMAVATWLFSLPSTSVYQYLLADRWRRATTPLNPKLVGYELSTIYNPATQTPREATAANTISNIECSAISTDLSLRLWQANDTISFLNTLGLPVWFTANTTILGLSKCQSNQIQAWLTSWQSHPWLRQYVEYNWFTACMNTPCSSTIPSLYEVNGGFEIVLPTTANFTVWPKASKIVWDSQNSLAFLHPTGIKLWRTLLTNCLSSTKNGTCSADPTQTTPSTAISFLTTSLVAVTGASVSDIRSFIFAIGQIWLLHLLDTPKFSQYLLKQVGGTSITGLATQQWIDASVFSVNLGFTEPGMRSLRDWNDVDVWNATSQSFTRQALPEYAGFPELRSFCAYALPQQPYDVSPECALGLRYTIDDMKASTWLMVFTDTTLVTVRGLAMARGIMAMDIFLSQPFQQLDSCLDSAALLLSLYPRKNTTLPDCIQLTKGFSSLNLFAINSPTVFPSYSMEQLTDMKQYFLYIASKFGYERPQLYPHGSYLTQQKVHDLLWRNTATKEDAYRFPTGSLPVENIQFGPGSILRTPLVVNTTANASTTTTSIGFTKKYGCVIAQVAAEGVEYQDPSCSQTDGSIFPPGTPTTRSFYWSIGRQVLNINMGATITRFGVSLQRYFWPTSWITIDETIYDDLPTTITPPHLYNLTKTSNPFALGLNPDAAQHATYIDIEPLTGNVLHSRMNWQINVQLSPTAKWSPNVSSVYLPVFWMRQERSIAAGSSITFGDLSNPGPLAAEKVAIWEIIWGVALICVGVFLLRRMQLAQQRLVRLIQPDDEGSSSKKVDALVEATEPSKAR